MKSFDGAFADWCLAAAAFITALTALVASLVALRKEWSHLRDSHNGKEGNGTHTEMDAKPKQVE